MLTQLILTSAYMLSKKYIIITFIYYMFIIVIHFKFGVRKFTFQCFLPTFIVLCFIHSTVLYRTPYKLLPVNPILFKE